MVDSKYLSVQIRKDLLKCRFKSSGHLSGPLGLVDLVSVLYADILRYDVNNPGFDNRDRLVVSGYQYPAIYAALAEIGFFPKQLLSEMDRCDSALVPNNKLPGFEISAYSSLGQGLSIAIGIAFGLKIKQNRHNHVYCIIGDGELDEGQVWESIFTALHYNLSQLVIIFNINGYQNDGKTIDIKNIPIQKVVTSLNINSIEIDGHNHSSIRTGLKSIINKEGPKVVICKTIKGKGISFIEQNPIKYHACRLSKEEYDQAMSELNNSS